MSSAPTLLMASAACGETHRFNVFDFGSVSSLQPAGRGENCLAQTFPASTYQPTARGQAGARERWISREPNRPLSPRTSAVGKPRTLSGPPRENFSVSDRGSGDQTPEPLVTKVQVSAKGLL